MEVQVPEDAAAAVGLATKVRPEQRDRVSSFLCGGSPTGDVVRTPCPVCGTRIDARPITFAGKTWSRLTTHLVTAHDAWWPQLTHLDEELSGDAANRETETATREVDLSSIAEYPMARIRPSEPEEPRLPPAPQPRVPLDRRLPVRPLQARVTVEGPPPGRSERQKERFGMLETEAGAAIADTYGISPQLTSEIVRVAKAVGAHPFDLANLISFESAGTFSPRVAGPKSTGATGLIQITESTARWLGTTTTALAKLDAVGQMPWVQTYLDKIRNGRPLDTMQKVAMAVFYPRAIDWPADQRFPAEVSKRNTHRLADGTIFPIRTPADYLTLMRGRSKLPSGDVAGPITASADPGVLDSILNWWTGIFGPGDSSTPTVDATTDAPAAASWDLSPGVSAILRSDDGKSWPAGLVPPGTYQLVVSGKTVPSPRVLLEAGRKYRASSIGQLFQVG